MRCLVLGGGGFIGSHVVEQLSHAGHSVRILDLGPNPYADTPSGVECLWCDWIDEEILDRAMEGMETVVHLIGALWPGKDAAGPDAVESELKPALRMLERCVANGIRRIVFLSSGGTVYGIPEYTPIDETHPLNPICVYGWAKLLTERCIRLFHHTHGLEYIILRGSNVYGERHNLDRPQGAVDVFLRQMNKQSEIDIWGDGEIVRDFLYVGDMARAILMALTAPSKAEVLNVGSGKGVSLNGLLLALKARTGATPLVRYLSGRTCDVPVSILNIDRINKALGWTPEVSLSQGVERTWRWIRSAMEKTG